MWYLLSKHGDGGSGTTGGIAVDDQEFQEAEVWEADFEPRSSSNLKMKKSKFRKSSSAVGGAHHHHGGQRESSHPMPTPAGVFANGGGGGGGGGEAEDSNNEEEMIPPHEWIARRLARSHISSSSVCEGAGRTLKGRDLSRVRNAVLVKTGFLEPQ